VGAIEESGNQTLSERNFCALGCPEEEREEEKLAAVALTPSVGTWARVAPEWCEQDQRDVHANFKPSGSPH